VDVTATPACSHGLTPNQGMAHSQGLAPSQGMGPRQGIAAIEEPQSISHDDCMNTVSLVPELPGIRNHKMHPRNSLQLTRIQFVDGDNCAVVPPSMHPFEVIPLGFCAALLDYIGARHVGVHLGSHGIDWDCDNCSPRWYDWRCSACCTTVPPRWTVETHFGQCGQNCSCCRARNIEDGPACCPHCFSIACVQMVDKRCSDAVLCARAAGAPL
jgi:hypothetical protein